ncbi:unnamed protein product [Anisakis simplex]|uniref:BRO1 domain-containing protein n=1 Tax=Anisakis simplex TaxID=6269 RepID=A0A0M3J8F1_ANISI|nr:unnamed protein product [Anisakis simplex]
MLRPELFDRALEVHKYLSESFSVVVDGRAYHHSDLCKQYCDVNKALYVLKDSQRQIMEAEQANKPPPPNIIIDHPKSTIHGFVVVFVVVLFEIVSVSDGWVLRKLNIALANRMFWKLFKSGIQIYNECSIIYILCDFTIRMQWSYLTNHTNTAR